MFVVGNKKSRLEILGRLVLCNGIVVLEHEENACHNAVVAYAVSVHNFAIGGVEVAIPCGSIVILKAHFPV